MFAVDRQKFIPVSHQQLEDIEDYAENWGTNGYWVLSIPFVVALILVICAIVIL
jgi:hypothetical protein